jgi:hypothetical protein
MRLSHVGFTCSGCPTSQLHAVVLGDGSCRLERAPSFDQEGRQRPGRPTELIWSDICLKQMRKT